MYRQNLVIGALLFALSGCSSQGNLTQNADLANDVSSPLSVSVRHSDTLGLASRRELAQAQLSNIARLAKERNRYAKLGFHTPEEAASATLGEAWPIYRVPVDSLRGYHRGDDLGALMVDTNSAFQLTLVDGKAVSGIMLGKENGAWSVTSIGRPTWAQAAQTTRERIAASRGITPSELAFVEVETPQVVLLVRHAEAGAILLTSVVDLPAAKLRAGETLAAADALEGLQAMASNSGM